MKRNIEVTFWSFAVMVVSIAVDASRSRVLSAAAKKYNSQALEADALHFQTDIWSSAVVIVGLIAAKFGFAAADALAALGVSVVVVWVSIQLGRRTVDALLDSAPAGLEERIVRIVESVPGVQNCHNLRFRYSGPVLFIDLHVLVDGRQTLAEAHRPDREHRIGHSGDRAARRYHRAPGTVLTPLQLAEGANHVAMRQHDVGIALHRLEIFAGESDGVFARARPECAPATVRRSASAGVAGSSASRVSSMTTMNWDSSCSQANHGSWSTSSRYWPVDVILATSRSYTARSESSSDLWRCSSPLRRFLRRSWVRSGIGSILS